MNRMSIEELKSRRIAVLGLGVNNQGLARYLKSKDIAFKVFDDWKEPEELTGKLDEFDVVFRTPGLPYLSKPIQQAQDRRIIIYSQTKLFFDLCPCPIVGVTGTKGKGTTATLLTKILQAGGEQAFLAGNIGQDPFEFLDELDVNDLVVLELSSFQLQDLHRSPHLAVVLKTTVEHLDHHKNRQEYLAAKANIVRHQSEQDIAVLNYDHEDTRQLVDLTPARIWWNTTETQEVRPGSFVHDDRIVLALPDGDDVEIMKTGEVGLIGYFNLENVTACIAAGAALGVFDPELFREIIADFKGLEHRLEFVTEKNGVKYYNDSFSTTPETAVAALSAFEVPVILIVGGSEKGSDYQTLGKQIAHRQIKALIPIGTTGLKIAKEAQKSGYQGRVFEDDLSNMEQIVKQADAIAQPGDVVLLSPASASFDMFDNYKHRGELFKKFVSRLPDSK